MKTSFTFSNSNNIISHFVQIIFFIMVVLIIKPSYVFSQATVVNLATASNFAILAAAGITNTGNTILTGDIGSYPVAPITGFPPGIFSGTNHLGDDVTHIAMDDLLNAYLNVQGRTGALTIPSELGGQTLTSGVYTSASGMFTINGELTLNAQNNASSVFIFQMLSTFTTTSSSIVNTVKTRGSIVKLLNGTIWSQIYWQVGSSATLGDYSLLEGTILANSSITVGNDATVHGRLLAGAVTSTGTVILDNVTGLPNDAVLPVELSSFYAFLNNRIVELKWNTATEVNNYGFNIERKVEGEEWQIIGFIKGHGNSNSPQNYFFEDKNFQSGKLLYRLKQIDFNGASEYSNVVSVNVAAITNLEIYQNFPNPFNPTTTISFKIPVKTKVVVKVFNMLGSQLALLMNTEKVPGNYQVEFNASGLSSGVYFYSIYALGYKPILKKMILLK